METVQQNGRFTLFSSKFLSIYSILYAYLPLFQGGLGIVPFLWLEISILPFNKRLYKYFPNSLYYYHMSISLESKVGWNI